LRHRTEIYIILGKTLKAVSNSLYQHRHRAGNKTDNDTIIVRLSGEIGVKSQWTRANYERQLIKNMKSAFKAQNLKPIAIIRARGRIYVKTTKTEETANTLSHIFGISSVSKAKQTTSEPKEITKATLKIAKSILKEKQTFAVRCHRVGTHPYSSQQICRSLGEQILNNFQTINPKVNLTNPDVIFSVEVRDKGSFIYSETQPGPGGFPLGTQAKTVCLLSGGIDSPVACWLTMKRGSPVTPIYIDNDPFTDEQTKQKAIDITKKLAEWSTGHLNRLFIVPNGKNIKNIQEKAPLRFTCLLCKRLMYRIAEKIAGAEEAYGVVTGEAIGEQASQTMQNLFVIDEASIRYPIHRPLLGFDKLETEALARKIGTFQISISKAKSCCAAPSKPATKAKLEEVKEAEKALDMNSMAEKAWKASRVVEI
jgi:thiamine biosynthesis protein ThiI